MRRLSACPAAARAIQGALLRYGVHVIAAGGRETGMPEGSDSIFISYAGPDRQWAEWVAWCLEEAGHRVELDAS
ncbi:toll/interleukin-1 receptor domain-containing protein [Streptomyces sp. NPDC058572]|uniref:toll/interleukin-1 receptor domain-containing protein n=1 Tax=Streptomyces sp. NPDC058572 TaxID=3346546 RepID=UPI0036697DE5